MSEATHQADTDHLPAWRRCRRYGIPALIATGFLCSAAAAGAAEPRVAVESKTMTPTGIEVELDRGWHAWPATGLMTLEDFPLRFDLEVDLTLERFQVTTAGSRFVRGSHDGDEASGFDPQSVVLVRGSIDGEPSSRVFMALSEHGGFGAIERAGERYRISSLAEPSGDHRLASNSRLKVAPAIAAGGWPFGVPLCGLGDDVPPEAGQRNTVPEAGQRNRVPEAGQRNTVPEAGQRNTASETGQRNTVPRVPQMGLPKAGVAPVLGLRQIELAVETDHEFFQLFGDLDAAGAYVVAVYAAVSEIYLRDVNARVDLAFVRLWDDPDDLFNEPDPLGSFRSYWEANMGGVERDVAQFFSGRRDLPYGGVASIGGLCNSLGYSVAGYAVGFFGDTEGPDVFNRDITVTAHEIGHSSNAPHTHNIGVDSCNNENSVPQRGTIMSYCGQTFTGGAANTDLRLHTDIQEIIESFFGVSACLAADCNQNGIGDDLDIAAGSPDLNMNGVPDACEDCNGNEVLDDADIAGGGSSDVDGNGVPDECQPDCNANLVPDSFDVASGTSPDLYGDGIPDECDADCDGDSTSDYHQIQIDMSLDLNRNATLDACEDCDGDDTPDLIALDHAHNLWLTSQDHSTIREYLAAVGPLAGVSDDAGIAEGQDLLITADRRVLVSSRLDHRVVEFTVDGTLVGDLVAAGAGGLSEPAGLVIDGSSLLVASRGSDSVLIYDSVSGASLGELVAPGSGGLTAPFGLAFTPGGSNLLVTSNDGRVLEYNSGGAFVGEWVSSLDNGGLSDPRGLLFLPSGNLLVASYGSDQILEFDGTTRAFVRQFNQGGTADRLTLDQPWSLRLGPDGGVYVSRAHDHEDRRGPAALHLTNARVYHFDAESGFLMRAYVLGVNSGVEHPTGFDFVPGDATDCNRNLMPDVCDIQNGTSQDANGNGVPDSCESVIFADGFESGDTSAWQ